MNAATRRAYGNIPPTCEDNVNNYRIGMAEWTIGAIDAQGGDFKMTAAQIIKGARTISLISVLKQSVRKATVPVVVNVVPAATSPPPAPITPASPAPSAPAPAPAPTTEAGCYPLSDEGTCYEPGEYCRDDDHGVSGVAGDGEAITCEDNDGWRWEPA